MRKIGHLSLAIHGYEKDFIVIGNAVVNNASSASFTSAVIGVGDQDELQRMELGASTIAFVVVPRVGGFYEIQPCGCRSIG